MTRAKRGLDRVRSYDGEVDREVWSSFTYDPRNPQYAAMRASDADRALLTQVLAEAYADGRIDREELDERTEVAGRVRTLGEIGPLLADLVAPTAPGGSRSLAHVSNREIEQLAQRSWQAKRRDAAYSFLGVSGVTTAIWLATSFSNGSFDPYFFWPAFVIVFSLLHLVRVATSRREMVEAEVKRLERRREKEQRKPGWRW